MLPGALRNPTRQGILTTPDATYEWMSFGKHVNSFMKQPNQMTVAMIDVIDAYA